MSEVISEMLINKVVCWYCFACCCVFSHLIKGLIVLFVVHVSDRTTPSKHGQGKGCSSVAEQLGVPVTKAQKSKVHGTTANLPGHGSKHRLDRRRVWMAEKEQPYKQNRNWPQRPASSNIFHFLNLIGLHGKCMLTSQYTSQSGSFWTDETQFVFSERKNEAFREKKNKHTHQCLNQCRGLSRRSAIKHTRWCQRVLSQLQVLAPPVG